MTTIKRVIDGYICEFEGSDYQTPESDVGFWGGFENWEILGAEDDCGRQVDDATLRHLELRAVEDETIGDDIIVKLNNAYDEGSDDVFDPPDDWNRHEGYVPK